MKNKTTEQNKETKKRKKIKTSTIVFLSLTIISLLFGVIAKQIKQPIPNSIYYTNTTLKERQKTWDTKRSELFNSYSSTISLDDYRQQLEPHTTVCNILYEATYSNETKTTKKLRIDIINNSEKKVTMSTFEIINKANETDSYSIPIHDDIPSGGLYYGLVEVPIDFDINNFDVNANNLWYDGSYWTSFTLSPLSIELERLRSLDISKQIKQDIGERPTSEIENHATKKPSYMSAIEKASVSYIASFFLAWIFFLLTIITIVPQNRNESKPTLFSQGQKEVIVKEIQIIEKPVEVHKPIRKVTCLHCGSRYKDNLDECPNCGSAKIKDNKEDAN